MGFRKELIIEFIVLTAFGILLACMTGLSFAESVSRGLSDLFFAEASVFLFWALLHIVLNAHTFTFTGWSYKTLHRRMRGEVKKSDEQKEEYLDYLKSRKHHTDVPFLAAAAAIWLAMMFLVSAL